MDSSENHQRPESVRCKLCKGIQFDDLELGGFEKPPISGQSHLDFDLAGPDVYLSSNGQGELFLENFNIQDMFPSFPALTESCQNGCDFCGFLKATLCSDEVTYLLEDAFPQFKRMLIPADIYAYYIWDSPASGYGLSGLRFRVHVDDARYRGDVMADRSVCEILCRIKDVDGAASRDFKQWLRIKPAHKTVVNEESMEWINSELSKCINREDGHRSCLPRLSNTNFVPTKLIDVREDVLRLKNGESLDSENSSAGNGIKYATFSYCWGSAADGELQFKTKSTSIKERMSGFLLSDLPRAVQDAVIVMRSLSIDYLWVDSICVLQDDRADWERESAEIGRIYGSAYVTLCSLTPSCRIGFLYQEQPKVVMPFQSTLRRHIAGNFIVEYDSCTMMGLGREGWIQGVPDNRWFSRGWAFQEKMMSTRALLLWHSGAWFTCPCSEIELMGATGPRQSFCLDLLSLSSKYPEKNDVYRAWYQSVVSRYSDCQFTYPQDVLPAMSSLAQIFQEAIGDEYVAGLWKHDLVRGLMWHYYRDIKPLHGSLKSFLATLVSSDNYVAPSWSWAGNHFLECLPETYTETIEEDCHVLTVSTTVLGQDEFGKIEDGELEIDGHIIDFEAVEPVASVRGITPLSLPNGVTVLCNLDYSTYDRQILVRDFKFLVLGCCVRSQSPVGQRRPSHVAQQCQKGKRYKESCRTFGLILHSARSPGKYLRVGIFEQKEKGSWQQFEQLERETVIII